MCGGSTCKIAVIADWQFLRTSNKLNHHRSMHACLFARTASACGAWARISVASAVPPALASRLRMQLDNAPECSASARVQSSGGAVFMSKGALVFDGVAISDTRATVRRPFDARAGRPLRLHACGGPAPDRRRVQEYGGAVYMAGGAVTFRGSSTITRTQAVRLAQRTPSRARAIVVLVCGASTGTGTSV
jgi:hypothetical protein